MASFLLRSLILCTSSRCLTISKLQLGIETRDQCRQELELQLKLSCIHPCYRPLRFEINPAYSLEGLKSRLIGKAPDAWKDWRQEETRVTEDEMVGWHHWLSGHESEQTPGDSDGQGSLVCCSPWGHKELDTTERLNNESTLLLCVRWGHWGMKREHTI